MARTTNCRPHGFDFDCFITGRLNSCDVWHATRHSLKKFSCFDLSVSGNYMFVLLSFCHVYIHSALSLYYCKIDEKL